MPEFEPSPFDHQFARLVQLREGPEAEALFTELLRHGGTILDPIHAFLLRYPDEPDTAILVTLAAKTMEIQAVTLLMKLLDSPVPEIRKAAANGLGWNRAASALPHLDRLEGTDPDPGVVAEARAAIEEILARHPGKSSELSHHQPLLMDPSSLEGETDEGELLGTDRRRLLAALPRLLALEFRALPLGFTSDGKLRVAVAEEAAASAAVILRELTGSEADIETWNTEVIQRAINDFYQLGDDDFCLVHAHMTPAARRELANLIIASVRAQEPACPLDEASDAVEAVQGLLSSCGALEVALATIEYQAPHLTVALQDRDGKAIYMGTPRPAIRRRFIQTLRFLIGEESPRQTMKEIHGEILCDSSNPAIHITYEEKRQEEGAKIRLGFAYLKG